MKKKTLNPEITALFNQVSEETFTLTQLLQIYLNSSVRKHSDNKIARQFLHRSVQKFIAHGDMKEVGRDGRSRLYAFTDQSLLKRVKSQDNPKVQAFTATSRKLDLEKELSARLSHQKVMLLTAMGEAEEYEAIYKKMPAIHPDIQDLYNESRDRCSKLLGKIKALENLMNTVQA